MSQYNRTTVLGKRRRTNQQTSNVAQMGVPVNTVMQEVVNQAVNASKTRYYSKTAQTLMKSGNGPSTEFHARVIYPQAYQGDHEQGTDPPSTPSVEFKGSLLPHMFSHSMPQCLSFCTQGNGYSDRNALAVNMKGIQLVMTIRQPDHAPVDNGGNNKAPLTLINPWKYDAPPQFSNGAPSFQNGVTFAGAGVRVIVLLDKTFTGGIPPTLGEIFEAGTVSHLPIGNNINNRYSPTCQMTPAATQRFIVLMNKIINPAKIVGTHTFKKNFKLDGIAQRYKDNGNDNLPSRTAQNTVWMFVLADPFSPYGGDDQDQAIFMPTYTYTARFRWSDHK